MARTLVAVVGCHRSGTSTTAGVLASLGYDVGPDLMAPSAANPAGYFESMPVVAVHDTLLARCDMSWDTEELPVMQPSTRWAFKVACMRLADVIRQCRGDVFALKDPRMALFPELWMHAARQAGVQLAPLYVHRSAAAIVRSLRARDCFTQRHAEQVVGTYMRGMIRWQGSVAIGTSVCYTALLQDWETEMGEALQALGLPFDLTPDTRAAVSAFIDPELNHHG